MPKDKTTRISDGPFCGAIVDRLLMSEIGGEHPAHQIYRHEELKRQLKTSLERTGCTVAYEPHQEDGVCRGDLHIRGGFVGGNIIADLTVVLASGAATHVADNQSTSPGFSQDQAHKSIQKALDTRYSAKLQKYRGKTFPAPVQQWVLTAGGHVHRVFEKHLDSLKKYDRRLHSELLWTISMILMQYRARVGLNRLLEL